MISRTSDYKKYLPKSNNISYQEVANILIAKLPQVWIQAYHESCLNRMHNILDVTLDGITNLFDAVNLVNNSDSDNEYDDRTVVVYGFSQRNMEDRDESRMQGFLKGSSILGKNKMDKGHFASHRQGGGLDINLFPQHFEVNQGRKANHGVDYRKMEKYCAKNPGTFFFSRPIYIDDSWVPFALEYGILKQEKIGNSVSIELEVNEFIN